MALLVAQIFNLPYRRFGIGRASVELNASDGADVRRMQFCDTADYKSALRITQAAKNLRCATVHPEVVGGTVAAAILAAVEGAHLAARTCARSSEIAGACTPVPPGRMPRLYGSQDGRRYQQLGLGTDRPAAPPRPSGQRFREGQPRPSQLHPLIWMDGGPSHYETFDPKPDAPKEIRGDLAPDQDGGSRSSFLRNGAKAGRHRGQTDDRPLHLSSRSQPTAAATTT